MVATVSVGTNVTESEIDNIISAINSEENTRTAGGSGYGDLGDVSPDANVVGQKFKDMVTRLGEVNSEHCYCQGQGSIATHNGGVGISITSSGGDYDAGSDEITAGNINEIVTDINNLVAQCDCDGYSCACEVYCNCETYCSCNYYCTCDYYCICDNQCTCQTNCTCDTRCVCYYNCTCDYNQQITCGCNTFDCPEFECLVCTCNRRAICTCQSQCNCQTNCDCDTNCGCNRDCSCDYNCVCNTVDSCQVNCTCDTNQTISCTCNNDCTCDDRCNCEYGG